MARHSKERERPLFAPKPVLPITAALTAAVVVALGASSGTYALWNQSQTLAPLALSAGTASLVVTTPLVLPATPLYPGLTVFGFETVSNTGTVPLTMTASLTAPASGNDYSNSLTIALATASTAANCALGIVTSAWSSGTFATPLVSAFGSALAASSTGTIVCVSVALAAGAPASAQALAANNFGITVIGAQS
jgi:hypothetical protein